MVVIMRAYRQSMRHVVGSQQNANFHYDISMNFDEDLTLKANAKDLASKVKARTRTTILSLRTTKNQGQHLWILA